MKITKAFLLLIAATLAFGTLAPRQAHAQVSATFFYDNLDPYGEWVQDPDYGYCWHPTGVDENWAPYTDGYWAYTDAGWTWVSYEDYGGIVYHYGRWARIPGEGWVWVPGETWAPAWVSWRSSDDYVGWAPLPPEARWHVGIGFGGGVDASFNIGPGFYSFVSVGDFGAPALGSVIVNRDRNVTIINNTTNITNITTNNSTVYTGGPNYAKIAARSSRPIPTLKLVRQSNLAQGGKILSHQQGNQLIVVAPKITASANGKLPPPPKVAKTLTGVKPDHGWDAVKDPQEREQLQSKFKTEASTAGNSAKPVNPEDLKLNQPVTPSKGTTTAGQSVSTPKPGKAKKSKTPSTADLLNAPATEESGAATPAETPKTKGKSKKSKTPSATESSFLNTGANGSSDATGNETPKPKKSKKSKTPSSSYDSSSSGEETPSKHSKKSDSNLQPFMGGDTSEPKPESKSSKNSEYSTGAAAGNYNPAAGQSGSPKGKKKKPKNDENNYNQPGQ